MGSGDHSIEPGSGSARPTDREEIAALKARYVRSIDTQDWVGLRDVFTAEVVIDTTGDGAGTRTDPDEFVRRVSQVLAGATSIHRVFLPELTVGADGTASGIWAMEDDIWWPAGGPVAHLHGAGHYHETYRRGPDGWRIRTMTLARTFRRLYDAAGTELRS
jgi:hypothetical protein